MGPHEEAANSRLLSRSTLYSQPLLKGFPQPWNFLEYPHYTPPQSLATSFAYISHRSRIHLCFPITKSQASNSPTGAAFRPEVLTLKLPPKLKRFQAYKKREPKYGNMGNCLIADLVNTASTMTQRISKRQPPASGSASGTVPQQLICLQTQPITLC